MCMSCFTRYFDVLQEAPQTPIQTRPATVQARVAAQVAAVALAVILTLTVTVQAIARQQSIPNSLRAMQDTGSLSVTQKLPESEMISVVCHNISGIDLGPGSQAQLQDTMTDMVTHGLTTGMKMHSMVGQIIGIAGMTGWLVKTDMTDAPQAVGMNQREKPVMLLKFRSLGWLVVLSVYLEGQMMASMIGGLGNMSLTLIGIAQTATLHTLQTVTSVERAPQGPQVVIVIRQAVSHRLINTITTLMHLLPC